MSMFPHTVTVFTPTVTLETATMTDTVEMKIFLLSGVLFAPVNQATARAEGKNGADVVKLYIPMDVDGGENLEIIPGKSFFVLGDVQEPVSDFETLNRTHKHVYRINSLSTYDFGDLRNWEVGGN